MEFLWIVTLISSLIWGIATHKVIQNKGYDENWFWWGFFFGIIALIVALTKPENKYNQTSTVTKEWKDRQTMKNGGWKCSCGRINPHYTGTCACGKSKENM